jgi:hypothetical protein
MKPMEGTIDSALALAPASDRRMCINRKEEEKENSYTWFFVSFLPPRARGVRRVRSTWIGNGIGTAIKGCRVKIKTTHV